MKLQDLVKALPFSKQIISSENPEIVKIEQDTRKVEKGTLFICIEGAETDGHHFAKEAAEKGAAAIIANRPVDVNVPVILVKNTVRAMAVLADVFYGHPSTKMKMIGITGTNGKTSVSHLVEHILRINGKRTGLIGTLYSKIGNETYETKNTTPDSLTLQKTYAQMVKEKTDIVSMEVSSHALAQGRTWGSDFDIAVFTNMSQDHLDYHNTMEEYRRVKGLLFSQLGNTYGEGRRKFAVLNADDETYSYFENITSAYVLSYGINNPADIMATDIHLTENGTTFSLETPLGEITVHVPLIGLFNVYNSLAAIAAAVALGLDLDSIIKALASFSGVPGRMELVKENQPFSVIVDYAHTPDGLENVLKTVKSLAKGRIFTVVGCGGDRDRKKRPIMAKIACTYSDIPIFTSDNPRSENPLNILKDMEEGVMGLYYELIPDRKEAINQAIKNAAPGDIIVIAGKGHETYQIIGDQTIDFDDRLVAKKAIQDRY